MKNLNECILTVLFLAIMTTGISQVEMDSEDHEPLEQSDRKKGRKEKIKAHKVAYLKKKMSLSSEESDVFWPMYNDFIEKKEALRQVVRGDRKTGKKTKGKLTDDEMSQIVERRMQFKTDLFNLEKEFHVWLTSALSIQKVFVFYQSEKEFKRKLIRKMRARNIGGAKK